MSENIFRKIESFGARISYTRVDDIWVEDPNQESVDDKINAWVEKTGNIIRSVSVSFKEHISEDKQTMYTDFLYIVVHEAARACEVKEERTIVPAVSAESDLPGLEKLHDGPGNSKR